MNKKIVLKSDVVNATSELWFGRFTNFLFRNPDEFATNSKNIICFPQVWRYKLKIRQLVYLKRTFTAGFKPFVSKIHGYYNNTVLKLLIHDPTNSNNRSVDDYCKNYKDIYDFLVENNLQNLIIKTDEFVCKFGIKGELLDFDDVSHVYRDIYFGLKINDISKNKLEHSYYKD